MTCSKGGRRDIFPWRSAADSCSTTSSLLLNERADEAEGFRHVAPSADAAGTMERASRHDRWVINKLRALCTWYTKGLDDGSHLRIAVNAATA